MGVAPLPLIVRVRLVSKSACRLPPFTGFYVRGLVYRILNVADPRLARRIHDSKELKPFAISPLRPLGSKMNIVDDKWVFGEEFSCVFDVKFIDDGFGEVFLNGLIDLERIGLGDCEFDLSRLDLNKKSFEELARMNYDGRIGVEFITPTYFNIRGKTLPYLLPDLKRISGNLLSIWNSFAPTNLTFDTDEALGAIENSAYIKSYNLRTREVRFEDTKLTGFKGRIEIVYSKKNTNGAKYLTPLLHLAEISNIGEKRTYGFGVVKIKYLNF